MQSTATTATATTTAQIEPVINSAVRHFEEMQVRKEIACLAHTINTKQELRVEELQLLHTRMGTLRDRLNILAQGATSEKAITGVMTDVNQSEVRESETQSGLNAQGTSVRSTSQRSNLNVAPSMLMAPNTAPNNVPNLVLRQQNLGLCAECPPGIMPVAANFRWKKRSSKGKISKTDLRVSKLPPLPICKKGCSCPNQCDALTKDTNLQQRLRDDYCDFVRDNDHQSSNQYLASFLYPNQGRFLESIRCGRTPVMGATVGCIWCRTVPSTAHDKQHELSRYTCPHWVASQNFYLRYANVKTFCYAVPMIDEKNEKTGKHVDICVSTFQALYALSSDRLTTIRKARLCQALNAEAEEIQHTARKRNSCDDMRAFVDMRNSHFPPPPAHHPAIMGSLRDMLLGPDAARFSSWRNQILEHGSKDDIEFFLRFERLINAPTFPNPQQKRQRISM